jgi:hypothetical protein
MFGNRALLISHKEITICIEVFQLNPIFFSSIIKDSIMETPKNVKKLNKSSQKCSQNRFLDDILTDNPGTK